MLAWVRGEEGFLSPLLEVSEHISMLEVFVGLINK